MLYFPISFDYIIQSYYRLKSRKNHQNLDFEKLGKIKSLQIFLSFICLYEKLNFFTLTDQIIKVYGLSFSDEIINYKENSTFALIKRFRKLMDKIIPIKFKFNIINKLNNEILKLFDDIEIEIPEDNFKDTRNLIRKEIFESKIFSL
jgi:hypothetical protein